MVCVILSNEQWRFMSDHGASVKITQAIVNLPIAINQE